MIKELTELVTLVEQVLPNHEALLALFSKNNRDVLKLFHVVQGNSFRTEAEAIDKAKVGERTKFRQVAKDLLRCLEQMVLMIDFDKQVLDELNHARIRGYQWMATAKSLAPLACKNGAKRAAEALLKIGQQYARPEFVVEASKVLMEYASVASDDPGDFELYLSMYQEHSRWRLLEERILIELNRITLPYIKKRALQCENAALALRCVNEFEPFVEQIPSHAFHIAFYSLKSKMFMMEAQYQEAAKTHKEAIQYFIARPYPCNAALNIFYYLEIANCVYLGQYQRGRDCFQKALDVALVGSVNWFNTLELGFYLRMHEQDWVGAAEVYAMATKHKRFNVLHDAKREIWHILGAYLYIMQKLTGADIPEGMVPKVKSSKFRNETKDFSHDKMGMNIAILAAEVLLDFVEEKDEELWDRIAALEKYRERYLRNNEDTHRSQLFIKIMSILSKYNYDRNKFLEKAEPYLAEMRTAPLQLSNQAHELEIVPYEKLVLAIAGQIRQRWGQLRETPAWLRANVPNAGSTPVLVAT
ncbi:MAG: hypothetical protein H7246_01585 [Phycisphaerae bacterium]|nr:hypothetical protein [Saprospiraceae bacterium]